MVKSRTVLIGLGILALAGLSSGDGSNGGDGGGDVPTNQPPVADFSVTPSVEHISAMSDAYDPDGTVDAYDWYLTKGGQDWAYGSGATFETDLLNGGTYELRHVVTDDGGATAEQTKTITVPSG